MQKNLFILLLVIFLGACGDKEAENQEKKDSTKTALPTMKPRTIKEVEKSFVGKWSTAFKDVKGNLVLPKQTFGAYMEYKNDGTYQIYRNEKVIREGFWEYEEAEKMLKMQTKVNTNFFLITDIKPKQLEMTDQKRGFKLVYVPYEYE